MAKNTLPDPCLMFKHACGFIACAESSEIEPINNKYTVQSYAVPGIVNSAFACEVLIKALLVCKGMKVKDLKDHKLKDLWNKYKAKDYEKAQQIETGIQKWFNSEDEKKFSELLNSASNAYEYWRYIYEKKEGSINIHFLRGFRTSLREVCCNQLFGKSWAEYLDDVR